MKKEKKKRSIARTNTDENENVKEKCENLLLILGYIHSILVRMKRSIELTRE